MITTSETLREIKSKFDDVLLKKGFEINSIGYYVYKTKDATYTFFVGIGPNYYPVSFDLVAGLSISIHYVDDIFNKLMYQFDENFIAKRNTCGTKLLYFKSKLNLHYEITAHSNIGDVLDEVEALLNDNGFEFFNRFTDIREIDESVNVKRGFYDEVGSIIGGDLVEKAILALILAKLCRPEAVEALAVQYRDTLYNDAFYLSRYDPAVEYLLKTDIGSYRHIQPPF
ncbi:hypothetical protein [Xanthocytophaga flava]|uniref:hypothetical protein n=1 Tax=Xanthocytophaga flava TaxID=3048013 RepID=UPI0028D67492|nr:hypothetical protein [Xanthocytophaga flavus]MDJ1470988.1 hypothetical protein [Xanthocytophaga flavus]